MAILHISEADAARDLTALLNQLGEVSEIVIERSESNAVLMLQRKSDPAYEAWFDTQVQLAAEDSDEGIDSEAAQAEFQIFRETLAQKASK